MSYSKRRTRRDSLKYGESPFNNSNLKVESPIETIKKDA